MFSPVHAPCVVVLGLVACSGPPAPEIDAGPDGDAPAAAGLSIDWQSRPSSIPGPSGSNSTVDRIAFQARDLRVIGEPAPLTLPRLVVEWATGIVPARREVPNATPATYSRVLFTLDPGTETYAYQIAGTVEVDQVVYPFIIRDRTAAAIAMDFAIVLPPGGQASIPIRVEADKLVQSVDFRGVSPTAGTLIVEDGSPELAKVRAELPKSFGVHSS